jgi:hypothetical protein
VVRARLKTSGVKPVAVAVTAAVAVWVVVAAAAVWVVVAAAAVSVVVTAFAVVAVVAAFAVVAVVAAAVEGSVVVTAFAVASAVGTLALCPFAADDTVVVDAAAVGFEACPPLDERCAACTDRERALLPFAESLADDPDESAEPVSAEATP